MKIKCILFGHIEGKKCSVFKSEGMYLARCKRCGKLILCDEEDVR